MKRSGLLIATLAVMTAGAVGWVAGQQIKSPAQAAAEAEPPEPSLITVSVEKMVISNDIVTRGVVRYEEPRVLSVSSVSLEDVAPVITQVPEIGEEFAEGDVLYEVAGRPTFVLHGDLPLFRTVEIGDEGEDILQLQRALARLGFEITEFDGVYGRETEAAVVDFYESRDYEPLKAADAADAAEEDNGQSRPGHPAPEEEFLFFPAFPIRVLSVSVKRGDVAQGEIMQVSGAELRIASAVEILEAAYVEVGTLVTIELDREGTTSTGTISFVASEPGTHDLRPDQLYVEITPDEIHGETDGANVKVTIPVASTNGEVLAVPAAALSTTGSGDTVVTVEEPDGSTRSVTVTPGLSTNSGMVEIVPVDGRLEVGDRVIVGFQS